MTHTYNRDLLEDVQDDSVLDLLSQARDDLKNVNTSTTNSEIFEGLLDRLNLRSSILKTVIAADMRSDEGTELVNNWNKTEALAKALTRNQSFGKAVPSSFSPKVQRKLASTVPPRPIVIITFTEALEQLINLCKDGRKLAGVLDYNDSQSLMVCIRTALTKILLIIRPLCYYFKHRSLSRLYTSEHSCSTTSSAI